MRYYYCIMPSDAGFPLVDAELSKRRVDASYMALAPGGRIYRLAETEMTKLPRDKVSHYLGAESIGGWGMYPLSDVDEVVKICGGNGDWTKV